MTSKKLFTKEMRDVSKSIHNKSDALVNIKLGLSASDPQVWAEGLLIFYEIFKFLDNFLENHKDSLIGELIVDPAMFRTSSFESDLKFYYGSELWKSSDYVIRPEVQKYLDHLRSLQDDEPYYVMAYVYHLYMGLFSGGQILRAKRMLKFGSSTNEEREQGNDVTEFNGVPISVLKRKMKDAMNKIAEDLDESTRDAICAEGITVFELNNSIIKTVKGVDDIFNAKIKKWLAYFILTVLIIVALISYLFK